MQFDKDQAYWEETYPDYWRLVCQGTLRKNDGPSGGNDFDAFLDFAGILPGMQVLDACCGFGRMIPPLTARGARVTAFDISATYVDEVRQAHLDNPMVKDIFQASASDLTATNQFDRVLCFSTFDCLDQVPAINAFTRALKVGGAIVFHAKHYNYHPNDETALHAEQKSVENAFPISFVHLARFLADLKQNGLAADAVLHFPKRGDLARWAGLETAPDHFYEFAARIVKRKVVDELTWSDFSLPCSKPYEDWRNQCPS